MPPLNPAAPTFQPKTKSSPISVPSSPGPADDSLGLPDDPWALSNMTEMSVSPADLEELEEVEGWVLMMAELEGMEQDHLIELSLRHADKSQIAQIKEAALSRAGKQHHHRSHKKASKA